MGTTLSHDAQDFFDVTLRDKLPKYQKDIPYTVIVQTNKDVTTFAHVVLISRDYKPHSLSVLQDRLSDFIMSEGSRDTSFGDKSYEYRRSMWGLYDMLKNHPRKTVESLGSMDLVFSILLHGFSLNHEEMKHNGFQAIMAAWDEFYPDVPVNALLKQFPSFMANMHHDGSSAVTMDFMNCELLAIAALSKNITNDEKRAIIDDYRVYSGGLPLPWSRIPKEFHTKENIIKSFSEATPELLTSKLQINRMDEYFTVKTLDAMLGILETTCVTMAMAYMKDPFGVQRQPDFQDIVWKIVREYPSNGLPRDALAFLLKTLVQRGNVEPLVQRWHEWRASVMKGRKSRTNLNNIDVDVESKTPEDSPMVEHSKTIERVFRQAALSLHRPDLVLEFEVHKPQPSPMTWKPDSPGFGLRLLAYNRTTPPKHLIDAYPKAMKLVQDLTQVPSSFYDHGDVLNNVYRALSDGTLVMSETVERFLTAITESAKQRGIFYKNPPQATELSSKPALHCFQSKTLFLESGIKK